MPEPKKPGYNPRLLDTPDITAETLLRSYAIRKEVFNPGLLIEQIVMCWGGPGEFVKAIHSDYTHAKEGSTARIKIMSTICELIKWVAMEEKSRTPPMEDLSNEDLQKEIDDGLRRLGA